MTEQYQVVVKAGGLIGDLYKQEGAILGKCDGRHSACMSTHPYDSSKSKHPPPAASGKVGKRLPHIDII